LLVGVHGRAEGSSRARPHVLFQGTVHAHSLSVAVGMRSGASLLDVAEDGLCTRKSGRAEPSRRRSEGMRSCLLTICLSLRVVLESMRCVLTKSRPRAIRTAGSSSSGLRNAAICGKKNGFFCNQYENPALCPGSIVRSDHGLLRRMWNYTQPDRLLRRA